MLWNLWSVNSACFWLSVWQETQRPSCRKTWKPRLAASSIASSSPPKYQRSNGELPETIVRSKLAMACLTWVAVTASGLMPKAFSTISRYSGSALITSRIGWWLGSAISTGLRKGWPDWPSRSGSRPSQNWVKLKAALSTVGALRVPVSLLTPSETCSGLSVKALSRAWQVAQLTSPVALNRGSWNNLSPSATLAGVIGLSAGTGTAGRPSGGSAAPRPNAMTSAPPRAAPAMSERSVMI